jgi:hypothetical protein
MFHQNIRLPGVYIYNTDSATGRGLQGAPIYCTMPDLTIIAMNDTSEKVLVFPKYKVIFYVDGLDSASTVHDNTNGTKCIYQTSSNNATSCRVYYDGVEIPNCFSTTGN